MKNKKTSDYTRMQVKAFVGLLAAALFALLASGGISLVRYLGWGGNYPLYLGAVFLLLLLLLALLLLLSRSYAKPFKAIDSQLGTMLKDPSAEVQLPGGLEPMEQKLQGLKRAMEERTFREQLAEQQKNDLVMYLAHDIRTPLTSIIGYLSLLDEARDMPEAQREKYTHITLEKGYQLEKMINEFFEIARYSLQQIELRKEKVDLCYLLVQLTDELQPVLDKNGNTSVMEMDNEDIWVYGDREKLARVFSNLLKNAAAYSYPHTEIVISAEEQGENVEVSFRNQGKTIPPEKLEKLFDKFYRLDEARTTGSGSSGLGLAIAKEIVTLHGGTIRAESEKDTVTLRVAIPCSH